MSVFACDSNAISPVLHCKTDVMSNDLMLTCITSILGHYCMDSETVRKNNVVQIIVGSAANHLPSNPIAGANSAHNYHLSLSQLHITGLLDSQSHCTPHFVGQDPRNASTNHGHKSGK